MEHIARNFIENYFNINLEEFPKNSILRIDEQANDENLNKTYVNKIYVNSIAFIKLKNTY
jgi:hypothetical protein